MMISVFSDLDGFAYLTGTVQCIVSQYLSLMIQLQFLNISPYSHPSSECISVHGVTVVLLP